MNIHNMYFEDFTGTDMHATYRCQECNETMVGDHLLAIVHEELIDDPTHPYGVSATGKFQCHIRRCCYCRGTVNKI